MAKQKTIRKQLYNIEKEFSDIRNQHPGLAVLLEYRMKSFEQMNKKQLEMMHTGFGEILEKYVQKNENGFITENVDGRHSWKFKESIIDVETATTLVGNRVKMDFNSVCDEFFSKEITIEI